MTLKRLALPLVIIGLLLAAAVTLLPRATHKKSVLSREISPVEVQTVPHFQVAQRPDAPTSPPIADPHPRSWRPTSTDAYRNSVRAGYAWILRQMGMSEPDLDRLATGDFATLVKDLGKKADQGDRSAILSLGWLARRCVSSRSEEQLNGFQQSQSQDARLLPAADAEWFTSFLNQDIHAEKQRTAECAVIDQDHVEALLTGLSQQGDGASTFMLAERAGNMSDENRLAREAALQGFPEAQYEWALDLLNDPGGSFWHPQLGDPSAIDFLRSASDELATARASLAVCEYRGCSGEIPDPEKAILDARTAAQLGDPDAMISLAAIAPLSSISPVESQAWALFDVALEQRGCRIDNVSVNWMKSMAAQSAKATPEAQALADRNWQLYGPSAMQRLGC